MRGTTPTHIFRVPIDLTSAAEIEIDYSQEYDYTKQEYIILVKKELPDIEVMTDRLQVSLTQEETLRFTEGIVYMQIRARFPDNKAVKSVVKTTSADRLLREGVI